MPQDKLRRLLHSLTETEIKFFRQYARRHISKSKAIYLKVFDLMLKQKNDSDKQIRSKLNFKPSDDSYGSLKQYLYELVLKTLVLLREETSIFGEMLKELSAAEVLSEKQLFEDALKKLNRVKSATRDNELFSLAFVAAWFEEVIMRTTGYTLTTTRDTVDRFDKIKELIDQILSQIEMSVLFAGYGNLSQSGLVREEEEKNLQKIFNDPLLDDQHNYPLASAQRTYWMMKALKARFHGNKESATDYLHKIYALVNEYPVNFPYHEYLLIFTKYMRVLSRFEKGDLKEANGLLQDLKNFEALSNQNRYLLFRLTFLLELTMMKMQKKHEQCMSLIMEYESRAKSVRGRSFNVMEYRNYQAIISYLISTGQFNETLPFINEILNDKQTKNRGVSYQIYARIMNLIVHFELKNSDLVESGIRGMEYFMKKNHVQIKFIKHLLKFFRSVSYQSTRQKSALIELQHSLTPLAEIPQERVYLFDAIDSGWFQQRGIHLNMIGLRPMVM